MLAAGAVTLIFYSISNYLFDLSICIFLSRFFFYLFNVISPRWDFFSLKLKWNRFFFLCSSRNYLSKLCKFNIKFHFSINYLLERLRQILWRWREEFFLMKFIMTTDNLSSFHHENNTEKWKNSIQISMVKINI